MQVLKLPHLPHVGHFQLNRAPQLPAGAFCGAPPHRYIPPRQATGRGCNKTQ